jgi:PleD family two-component response regulator
MDADSSWLTADSFYKEAAMIDYPLSREEGVMGNSPERTGTMRRRILVLDGDPETRMMLQELLEELGFDVLITSDARTGLVLMGAELGRGLGSTACCSIC